MVSFTFSAEQVKMAPPEVRRWMENEIVKALSGAPQSAAAQSFVSQPVEDTTQSLEGALAAGNAEELQETFKRISGNSIVARVFFELARDTAFAPVPTPFHVVNLGDVMRHLQLADAEQLFTCLDVINQAFQQIRSDPEASLFAFDDRGHIYLHNMTYRGIRQVWQQLVTAHPWPATGHMAAAPSFKAAPSGVRPVSANAEQTFVRPEHAFAGTSND